MKDVLVRPKKDNVTAYLEIAERLDMIIPTVDPANGDMIIVYRTEEARGGRSFRLSPEMGAQFRSLFSQMIRERRTDQSVVFSSNDFPARCRWWRAF